ncbi:MAG TPA: hypothetical protein VGU90_14630 [Terriglobales bacterium]|nr:hypothetical protein [Terriglobales bacterium]
MAEKQATNGKDYDPIGAFREMRDNYLDAWAKTMVETVNTDAYAKTTGMLLDTYLSASSPFREAVEKAMLQTLQQLSMPSRADFVSLAERVTHIEMKLDDMDASLDRIEKLLATPIVVKAEKATSPKGSRKKKKGAR